MKILSNYANKSFGDNTAFKSNKLTIKIIGETLDRSSKPLQSVDMFVKNKLSNNDTIKVYVRHLKDEFMREHGRNISKVGFDDAGSVKVTIKSKIGGRFSMGAQTYSYSQPQGKDVPESIVAARIMGHVLDRIVL